MTHLWHGGGQAGAEAALSTVRSLLSGQLASQQRAPLTPEGFRQLAKLRQEVRGTSGNWRVSMNGKAVLVPAPRPAVSPSTQLPSPRALQPSDRAT